MILLNVVARNRVILVKLGAKPDFNSQKPGLLIIVESFRKYKSYSIVIKDSKNGEKSFYLRRQDQGSIFLAQPTLHLAIKREVHFIIIHFLKMFCLAIPTAPIF